MLLRHPYPTLPSNFKTTSADPHASSRQNTRLRNWQRGWNYRLDGTIVLPDAITRTVGDKASSEGSQYLAP